ncbi:quinon protein alcohol dehydrogenase-like superfamily [Gilbertella persicaria]|uniref:Substrate-specific activator of APC-dependent proteolysis n=1 Tax=Rhizopus stolonifer TaxID=4846 RepID=A0A367KJA7_RHIST|nr:quinon protein alcohol dehydrogenase-like superfamily [Gilbertella persicaria]KAI8069023.1 quinon protein alcohol dehydrogenase-like superfamily [Gilbertella persicaria]RCI02315.1 substrate-specific activator of APC-dependent proteolysis [Rhizopus stolonifer]
MEDYRSKLRSFKTNTLHQETEEKKIKEEEPDIYQDDVLYQDDPDNLKISNPDIEPYFPPSPYGKRRDQPAGDRFIPSRERDFVRDFQMLDSSSKRSSDHLNTSVPESPTHQHESTRRFGAFFRAEILDDLSAVEEFVSSESPRTPRRVLHYAGHSTDNTSLEHTEPNASRFQTSPISEAGRRILSSSDRSIRHINPNAIKILDAPQLQEDFYLNLVDWGKHDYLAVGLGTAVYLWNASTSKVTKLCDLNTDAVTSVNWSRVGSLLAVGTHSGRTILYDTETSRPIRSWFNHSARVGAITWKSNILTTGSRDQSIYHHDVRSSNAYFCKLSGHTQEICGLKWNKEGTMLASGANDNTLLVWNLHENNILYRLTDHIAAVKAISWSPHKRGVLASGGGTADKTIKFWNTFNGTLTSSHDTGSQVCNLAWGKLTNEIVSTHGYSVQAVSTSNSVTVWKADKMQRMATLTGHNSRVLYLAMSEDGNTVVTGAGDETLRFWDVFSTVKSTKIMDPEDRKACLR